MMNLFKMLNLCASHLRHRDCPTTGFVYAYLIEDIFLCFKFTELRDTIFDHVQQLNFKCIWLGTFEIELIVAMVSDDINDEHQKKDTYICRCPQRDLMLLCSITSILKSL